MAQDDIPTLSDDEQAEKDAAVSETDRKRKLVERCLSDIKAGLSATDKQRQRETDDLEFELDQWPKEYRQQRAGGVDKVTGQTTPARPCLEINKLDQPIQQVINEARSSRLSIQIKPRGNGAKAETAKVRQGLIRAIEVDSNAHRHRMWALERAAKCGFGCYRVNKKFSNDGDFDMDLVVERILNQGAVVFDPFAKEEDWSDGEWAVELSDVSEEEHKRRWPKASLSTAGEGELTHISAQIPEWVSGEKGKRSFRIAQHYRVEHTERILLYLNGQKVFKDALPEGQVIPPGTKQRPVDFRSVKWCITNGHEILDEEDWEGRYIPLIPVKGKEYNVNGKRVFKGIISNAKDAQRSYNVMRSKQLEAIGLSTLAQWVIAEGQDEGYEDAWDNVNTRAFTRLHYRPTTFDGLLVPPPHRDIAEPAIAAITQAVREADNDIKSTTGRFDPSLGRQGKDQSGRAIRELKQQGETGTSNYLDNLATVSMVYEGKVLNDMLEYVYDAEGRIARLLGEEDEEDEVTLNQPYKDGQNGEMLQLDAATEAYDPSNPAHKFYNLKDGGQYRVVVTVGQSYPTQREEDRAFMGELAQAAPTLVPIYADLWVGSHDSRAAKSISERLKNNNPYAKGDKDDKKGQPQIPPEIQQQMQQMQQQLQAAQAEIQKLQQAVAVDKAKADAQIRMKQMELDVQQKIAMMEARLDLMKTRAALKSDAGAAMIEAEMYRMELMLDKDENEAGRRHEFMMAREGQRAAKAAAEAAAANGEGEEAE